MEIKIDTKERFYVVSVATPCLTATLSEELSQKLTPFLKTDVKSSDPSGNVVLKMTAVLSLDQDGAKKLMELQQEFYEHNRSFVICEMQKNVVDTLEQEELLEVMNVTPTESEAWDIVQMEEIERELLDNEFSDS
ncbi:MAG: STAS domain-containing protein [Sphingomonadales bacterium]|nr:STAS domain-containing protein [Sphingomonadales bacterium]